MSQGRDLRRDASLPLDQRRSRGVYYTPEAVVKYIVGETLTADLWQAGPPAVLDPACGDGAFLCEVAERLVKLLGRRSALARCSQVLFGIDRDEVAIAAARRNVSQLLLGDVARQSQTSELLRRLAKNIVVADALLDPIPKAWPPTFDAVVGNPPYVNIRRLADDPEMVARYRERFRCARRGFDLYVLFIERTLELLRKGGRCGFIVPNKLATLEYASQCRTMLIEQTQIDTLADFSECDVFQAASVYPHVLVFEKTTPDRFHQVLIVRPISSDHAETLRVKTVARIGQSQLHRRGVFDWCESFAVESRVATRPLGELCRLHSGTTGFAAQQIAAELRERSAGDDGFPFITSGNIDRYAISLGDVRYMKRKFVEPLLPRECSLLTSAKQELFAGPKIVIAGMSQRLECAWTDGNLALGVQVFAAAEIQCDPFYLLAVLNSRLLSHLFRTRFAAKRVGGGFFSVNKGQLAQLPIVDPAQVAGKSLRIVRQLSALGKWMTERGASLQLDAKVDALVEQLYALDATESSLLGPQVTLRAAA